MLTSSIIDRIQVEFQGLLGGGDLEKVVENIIDDMGKEVVDYAWSVVGDKVTKVILDLVNKALAS